MLKPLEEIKLRKFEPPANLEKFCFSIGLNRIETKVFSFLYKNRGQRFRATEIAKLIKGRGSSVQNVRKALRKLIDYGLIRKEGRSYSFDCDLSLWFRDFEHKIGSILERIKKMVDELA